MTTAVAPPASRALAARRAVLAVAAPRSWVALIHLVVDSLTALAITPPILLLMVVSAATIPIVPLAVLGFGLVLVLSVVEGRIVRATTGAVLGVHLPSPHTREPGTIWNRLVAHIRRAGSPVDATSLASFSDGVHERGSPSWTAPARTWDRGALRFRHRGQFIASSLMSEVAGVVQVGESGLYLNGGATPGVR